MADRLTSRPRLSAVRVAAALFVVYGVLGVISGLTYLLLGGHVSWTFIVLLPLFTAIYFLVGVKLLQLRYWALTAGRLLALLLAVSSLVGFGSFVGPPVLTLEMVAQFMVAIALAITVLLPAVSKAIRRPQGSTTE
jgi:hypothetical protein